MMGLKTFPENSTAAGDYSRPQSILARAFRGELVPQGPREEATSDYAIAVVLPWWNHRPSALIRSGNRQFGMLLNQMLGFSRRPNHPNWPNCAQTIASD